MARTCESKERLTLMAIEKLLQKFLIIQKPALELLVILNLPKLSLVNRTTLVPITSLLFTLIYRYSSNWIPVRFGVQQIQHFTNQLKVIVLVAVIPAYEVALVEECLGKALNRPLANQLSRNEFLLVRLYRYILRLSLSCRVPVFNFSIDPDVDTRSILVQWRLQKSAVATH